MEGNRKRKSTNLYNYIKQTAKGTKVIRIEVYNAEQFENSEDSVCRCAAEICVQHVVKNALFDDVYTKTKDLIGKIQEKMEAESTGWYYL